MRRLGELASPSRSWVRGNICFTPTLTLPLQGGGDLVWVSPRRIVFPPPNGVPSPLEGEGQGGG